MRSISKRFYFDHNATSPLATSVKEWIAGGDLSLGNPSSLHASGKKAQRLIKETSDYLLKTFHLEKTHNVFFHSGTSEGINTLVRGFFSSENGHFFCSNVDHPCAIALEEPLKEMGVQTHFFSVNVDGHFLKKDLIKIMNNQGGKKILNYTWANNETGVVSPLIWALDIKKQTNAFIHVDATQTPFKIPDWDYIPSELDFITYSGHKFGSLLGIGFSFVKKDLTFSPLIFGGEQQEKMRSGTLNTHGIYSLKWALEELHKKIDILSLAQKKNFIEDELLKIFAGKIEIVSKNQTRLANTFNLLVKGKKTHSLLIAFDLKGIDVGTTSACSSGLTTPSRVLKNMGYSDEEASSSLRFSFGNDLVENGDLYLNLISEVLKALIDKDQSP